MTESLFDANQLPAQELPTPPLRLRRVRLHGVGPDGARFDPLDLDFSTGSGAAARVLLSLTNTGGKSTLITLICSLIVPAARAQVGGKILGDYVLTGDTSHVVCEWEDSVTGHRTVTGTMMEWKDGRRQPPHKMRSTSNMHRAWYLFRTGPGLPGIDDLPFISEGRRMTYRHFRSAVDNLIDGHPDTHGMLVDTQQDWTSALERHTNIDPVLFGYQMRMNDSETGAEQLLQSFDSPDNVVRFFVAALNDQRDLEIFTEKLGTYAVLAAQRSSLADRSCFGDAVLPLTEQLAQLAETRQMAEGLLLQTITLGGEHVTSLLNRIAQDHRVLAEIDAAVIATGRTFADARRDYNRVSDIRQQLVLEQARARVTSTEQKVEDAKGIAAEADSRAKAWRAVGDVLALRIAREAAEAARQAYDKADADLGPLRTDVTKAAAELAGRLDALIAESTVGADNADDRAQAADELKKQSERKETDARIELSKLTDERSRARTTIDTARQSSSTAGAAGWLHEHESPGECLSRWQDSWATANRAAEAAAQQEQAAEQRFDELGDAIVSIGQSLIALRAQEQSATARADAIGTDLAAVGADPTIVELGGAEADDSETLTRVAGLAADAAHTADARATEHGSTAEAAYRQLSMLDLTGTAPTGQDVLDVLGVLTNAGIGSVTGLQWIETNIVDADAREPFIAANLELASGVVISDRNRFDDGVRLLLDSELHTRTPVTVTTPPTTATTAPQLIPFRHIVIPHRATWDRRWAAEMRQELEAAARQHDEQAQRAAASSRRYRASEAQCREFVRRWGSVTREDLDGAARRAADARRAAEAEVAGLTADQGRLRTLAATARAEQRKLITDAGIAGEHAKAAKDLVTQWEDAEQAEAAIVGIDSRFGRAKSMRDEAAACKEQAAESYKSAVQQAANLRSDCEAYRRERAELGVDESGIDPGGNPAILRTRWETLRDELAKAEHGMVEAARLEDANRAVSRASSQTQRHGTDTVRQAEILSDTIEASTTTTLTDAQLRAQAEFDHVHLAHLGARSAYEKACADLADAEPPSPDHQNYIDLTSTEWSPTCSDDIAELLERLEGHNLEMRTRRDAAETAHEEAKRLHAEVKTDLDSFTLTTEMWAAERIPTVAVFHGTSDTAREEMRAHVKNYQDRDRAAREARDAIHTAVTKVRATAADPRFAALETPDIIRIRSLPEADLVAEAQVLARRIRTVTDSARADLEQLDVHRNILCDDLLALCRTQRRMLREVSQSSRLPAGLGDLSDNPAIKIRFEEAPAVEAMARLADRVDTWSTELADNPKRAKSADVRARWLADAVRDTVVSRSRAGAWSIEILKPRIDGHVAYCPPDRIPHEFSGGQVLTLAVLVYCALSRVRSAHRQGGARPAGTLLLDNPFGAASAEPLIEMQHRLAAHTGVQLVCATGLHDPAVEAAFTGAGSVIVKLRNDGDLRRNLSFLRLRETIVDGIDVVESIVRERDPRSNQNWLDAITYEIR
ncbi:coiled-coil domain-containing protein [Nocardia stercoris]|uniref:Uncharacterized protein n=1 Tax=Nocardia stercoris TaxID=2483361 RepID=A0A3M2L4V3_9NOCA|nr:hypothetical protein [Nocardia stercoris]RMI32677.1 hypothetical protein EBN03_11970 [Nocardia stercoris]